MIAEMIILVVALLFLIMSIFLFNGKGKWLIAGYNTLSKKEREHYDEKKVCRAMGMICVVCCVMLCLLAYMGYRVDSGVMDEIYMLPFALIFAAVILATVIVAIRNINKKH